MPSVAVTDVARMRDELFFGKPNLGRRLSKFWVLLLLAAVIATAGVMADSTATVIGAMIVAPLMTPILGMVLAMATGNARSLIRCTLLVVAGVAAVIFVGWGFGHLSAVGVVAANNSQVAGRVHPGLIDLVAALATGAVGAFALTRSDVSDALPGVAIAISLVPPLAVVGLTLQAGATDQSAGAMLLFLTNVGAILLSGLIVMAIYGVGRTAEEEDASHGGGTAWYRRGAVWAVALFVVLLAIPLGTATVQLSSERVSIGTATTVADAWAAPAGWEIKSVEYGAAGLVIEASGPLPAPSAQELRAALDARGLGDTDVKLELIPQEDVLLPAHGR